MKQKRSETVTRHRRVAGMKRKPTKTVTYRGQSRPREDLAQLIALVNTEGLYKPGRELPEVYPYLTTDKTPPATTYELERALPEVSWQPLAKEALAKGADPFACDVWVKICEDAAAKLSAETRAFLGPASDLKVFLERYKLLESAGEALRGIAERHSKKPQRHTSEVMIQPAGFGEVDIPFSVPVSLVVNERGQFEVSGSQVLDALKDVRADRIRACAICGRIFWASRVNSECCSERCRKTYNKRESRKTQRELALKRKRNSIPRRV